jgi:hypothetical protein
MTQRHHDPEFALRRSSGAIRPSAPSLHGRRRARQKRDPTPQPRRRNRKRHEAQFATSWRGLLWYRQHAANARVLKISTRNRRAHRAGLPVPRYDRRHAVASGGSRRTALSQPSRIAIARRMAGRSRFQPRPSAAREICALLRRDLDDSGLDIGPDSKCNRADRRSLRRCEHISPASRRHSDVLRVK